MCLFFQWCGFLQLCRCPVYLPLFCRELTCERFLYRNRERVLIRQKCRTGRIWAFVSGKSWLVLGNQKYLTKGLLAFWVALSFFLCAYRFRTRIFPSVRKSDGSYCYEQAVIPPLARVTLHVVITEHRYLPSEIILFFRVGASCCLPLLCSRIVRYAFCPLIVWFKLPPQSDSDSAGSEFGQSFCLQIPHSCSGLSEELTGFL